MTPLVVGSGGPAKPLEVTPPVPGEEMTSSSACAIDHYAASQCVHVQMLAPTKEGANDSRLCPSTTSTSNLSSPFGGKTTAKLDAQKTDELGSGMCCYDWCEQIRITRTAPKTCTPPLYPRTECIDMPERGTSVPAAPPFERCPVGITLREMDRRKGAFSGRFDAASSTPPGDAGAARCCYAVCGPIQIAPVIGRPPRNGDSIALAPAIASDAWTMRDDSFAARPIPLSDALLEHASVAAFARLSLSLLAFGAPPELVARSHEAALDEIRHAQISFTRAGGGAIGPGPCPAFADLRAHASLEELAAETYVDGCIGETIAALELRMHGSDPIVLAMARDEERHAELAWRIVEWAISAGGATVRERIARVADERRTNGGALARWAHANVIEPCTKTLLQTA